MAKGTLRKETVKIEAVSRKPKYPKFNSGSVLIGEKWFNVAKGVSIDSFEKDNHYEVEIETNDKGYETVVGNLTIPFETKTVQAVERKESKTASPSLDAIKRWDVKKTISDWELYERGIGEHGLMNAVVSAFPGEALNAKEYEDAIRERFKTVLKVFEEERSK